MLCRLNELDEVVGLKDCPVGLHFDYVFIKEFGGGQYVAIHNISHIHATVNIVSIVVVMN